MARQLSLEALSEHLAALLADGSPATEGPLVGVEHEYRVVDDIDGSQVDFRRLILDLGLGRRRLDPDDPFAFRLPTGNVVTCDEQEAEIVLAPAELGPGAADRLAAETTRERTALAAMLPGGLSLIGHSTHVSVSTPTSLGPAVGRVFGARFAADLMRLADSPDRCGVWVRPRSERLELCLDYVDGDRLARVVTFAAAATIAARRAVEANDPTALPPALRGRSGAPQQRSGWHFPRRAFGGDPFGEDLDASLALAAGGHVAASDHIAAAWAAIRPVAGAQSTAAEVRRVDDAVRLETDSLGRPAEPIGRLAAAFGAALEPRARRRFEVAPVQVTWSAAVFLVLDRRRWLPRRTFASIPRARLATFLEALDGGRLDEVLAAALRRSGTRHLDRADQLASVGLFDSIGLRRALLPAEPQARSITIQLARRVAA